MATALATCSVGLGLATVAAGVAATPASADSPTPCVATTRTPRHYTHGSPHTGLVSRHGYYYLDVRFGRGCGVGRDGLVHIVGYVHALRVLPRVGDIAGGFVPGRRHHALYWLEFHGYADTGRTYPLPGPGVAGGDRYVSTTNHTQRCFPLGPGVAEMCQSGPGTSRLVLRYDGPDIFGLRHGGDARFRIANESGLIITDFAQVEIVASSTSWPRPLG